ncbi:ABC transporter ATP-binding protein [Macrococcus lamae]|uniref:ABC transporter ATP-binding protein n=1 Tax=Macrococcus lamae TaxID=198484 RepID=UPI001FB607F8|nr:ABC transporter ATP-binding protein [Macrococcus lamae]
MDERYNYAIEAHSLGKSFNGTAAVRNIDLKVDYGELFAFLGPNGSGKSTTIKMLIGLLKPDSGSVKMFGMDFERHALELKERFSFIPDTPHTLGKLTGDEYLNFIASIFKMDQDYYLSKRDELLQLFDLEGKTGQLIEGYSHGMKQKIVLVASLMHDPDIIFLDEPTVGLDPLSTRNLKNYLRMQCDQGKTVFLTTHILEIAEQMADRIAIVYNGSIKVEGNLSELQEMSHLPDATLEDVFLELTKGVSI